MSERSFVPPAKAEILRNVYVPCDFFVESPAEASEIGRRILNASGALDYDIPAVPDELRAEAIVIPTGEPQRIDYRARPKDVPGNYYRSEDFLLDLTFTQVDAGLTVGARAETRNRIGMISTLQTGAGVPVQAFDRKLTLSYKDPQTTIQALSELAVDVSSERITEQARRRTFAGLLRRVSDCDQAFESGVKYTMACLEAVLPEVMLDASVLRSQAEQGKLEGKQLNLALADIAKVAYMHSSSPKQTALIEAVNDNLQAIYWAHKDQTGPGFPFPPSYIFGPLRRGSPMSEERLHVPTQWWGPVIDKRIQVTANVEMDGAYDIDTHTFVPAERGRGLSGIEFVVKRAITDADPTEANLGTILDGQLEIIAGGRIPPAAWSEYRQLQQAEPAQFVGYKGKVTAQTFPQNKLPHPSTLKLRDYYNNHGRR